MQATVKPFHDLKILWQNATVRATAAKSALEVAKRAVSVAENCSLLVQSSVMSREAAADLVVVAKNRLVATQKELQEAEAAVLVFRNELHEAPREALRDVGAEILPPLKQLGVQVAAAALAAG